MTWVLEKREHEGKPRAVREPGASPTFRKLRCSALTEGTQCGGAACSHGIQEAGARKRGALGQPGASGILS